ncbi:hypothetical protein LTR17_024995 [Elasticomyces elasticus]|nr:hypothetical protein LTR17_024995 [Elasticomyces elasticus]
MASNDITFAVPGPSPPVQTDDCNNHSSVGDPLLSTASIIQSSVKADDPTKSLSQLPRGWPRHPRKLARNRLNLLIFTGVDGLLLLFSACFFIYGLLVLKYNNEAVDGHQQATNALLSAARIGPTVFPILFAAVLGRLIKYLMAWRLEVGESVGLFDLLAGSTTVANTIFTQSALRMPSLIGVALIIIWAFSPLGGQSSLRVVGLRDTTNSSVLPVSYMTNNVSYSGYFSGDLGNLKTLIFGLFNAAVLGPGRVKDSPVDTWNNVKIPMLEALTNDSRLLSDDNWFSVPDSTSVVYSSLIGLPVSNLPAGLNNTLCIETSYITLDCPQLGSSIATSNSSSWSGVGIPSDGSSFLSNATGSILGPDCRGGPQNSTLAPRFFTYYSYLGTRFGALCSMRTSYVEVEISCTGQDCRASKIRNSKLANAVPNWTFFDGQISGVDCRWFFYYANLFMTSVPVERSGTSTPLQGYLVDPDSPALPTLTQGGILALDPQIFAIRFAQLLNSFMMLCAGPYMVPYGFAGDIGNYGNMSTTVESIRTFKIMTCHPAWLTLLLLASLLLMSASLWTIVLQSKQVTPELALNWSTMTRDNPNILLANTGTTLDSSERSRLMKNTRLMFGDIASERDVGRLAVSSLADQGEVVKARRDRFYQ